MVKQETLTALALAREKQKRESKSWRISWAFSPTNCPRCGAE